MKKEKSVIFVRFNFLVAALLLVSVWGRCTVTPTNENAVEKPNIVYLFSDEHRYQSMSFTETPAVKTPNMARIAQEGVSFINAISNNPLCAPHRSMLLTGRWSYSTGMVENNGTLAPWDQTLGHVFNEAGYYTGYTGKWHAGSYPQLAGFDWHMHWNETNEHWNSSWTDLHGTGETHRCDTYNATKMTDQALEFIEDGAKNSSPFFLMVAWNPPHAVFTDAPEDKKSLYPSSEELPWRANAEEGSKEKWWDNYQGYHAHISAIDDEIGRVMDKLEELGIAGNTIIIYSADHGSMMNSHGKGNKRHPDEESIRVPFLVSYPAGIEPGLVKDELFGTIDIFPTLCGMAGIEIPSFCQGQDFSPLLFGESGPDPESQFLMHIGRKGVLNEDINTYHTPFFRGVRGKRYTYTVNTTGPWQLFDNQEDHYQKINLINDPAYSEVREQMQGELDYWIEKAENPFMHQEYQAMSLSERIYKQASLHNIGSQKLKEFTSRLKLSHAQEVKLEGIRYCVYDEKGKPRGTDSSKNWAEADKTLRKKIKSMLTPDQLIKFEELEALEKSALNN
jgi:arylsulfatase A-like enzyme